MSTYWGMVGNPNNMARETMREHLTVEETYRVYRVEVCYQCMRLGSHCESCMCSGPQLLMFPETFFTCTVSNTASGNDIQVESLSLRRETEGKALLPFRTHACGCQRGTWV
jgi:hypothetical protein